MIPRDGILKLSDHQVGKAVAIEIAERRRVVKCRQHGEVTTEPQCRRRACADVLKPVHATRFRIIGFDLRSDDQIEIAVAVDITKRRNRFGPEIDAVE